MMIAAVVPAKDGRRNEVERKERKNEKRPGRDEPMLNINDALVGLSMGNIGG
jgi:hypothetical protein